MQLWFRSSFHRSWLKSSQDAERENHALNITNTDSPAMYLVFLWLIWSYSLGCSCDVQEWLQWLELLASHPLSRRILILTASESMKARLSAMFCANSGNDDDLDNQYMPWVCSIPRRYRLSISHVSHLDWKHAQKTINSGLAQDRQTVEDEVSGTLHSESAADIRALIGALYICNFARDDGSFDIENVKLTHLKRGLGYCFMPLPKVTLTPVMIEVRNALQVAHPTCCQKIGPQILDWYSASIALLGIPDSVDHFLKWKCNDCIQCTAATRCQKLLRPHRSLPDSAKQQVFDVTIRELVSSFLFL